jgi:hypothetical protein
MFIVSSFMDPMKKCLWCGDFLEPKDAEAEKLKTPFATMRPRRESKSRRGLFDNRTGD